MMTTRIGVASGPAYRSDCPRDFEQHCPTWTPRSTVCPEVQRTARSTDQYRARSQHHRGTAGSTLNCQAARRSLSGYPAQSAEQEVELDR